MFYSRVLRASAFQRQIVNRNLIGRFTVFVGESPGAAPFSFCARGAFSCARHARCLRGRAYRHPVVCQPLNTGHPRSSPIFSPIATSWPIARLSWLTRHPIYIRPPRSFLYPRIMCGGESHCCIRALLHIAGTIDRWFMLSTSRRRELLRGIDTFPVISELFRQWTLPAITGSKML